MYVCVCIFFCISVLYRDSKQFYQAWTQGFSMQSQEYWFLWPFISIGHLHLFWSMEVLFSLWFNKEFDESERTTFRIKHQNLLLVAIKEDVTGQSTCSSAESTALFLFYFPLYTNSHFFPPDYFECSKNMKHFWKNTPKANSA